jgi:hypothetical protein
MKSNSMNCNHMRHLTLYILCISVLITSGCASRKFIISSDPEGAYIVGYGETNNDDPMNETLIFLGKSDLQSLVAMKRGYHPDTVTVSKDSPAELHFQLRSLEGIPPFIRKPMELSVENAHLLPVRVDIVLHKGVGAMDRYEESGELSGEAYTELNHELQVMQSDTTISVINMPGNAGWQSASDELEEYLQSLSTDLLPYYPECPTVAGILEKYSELFSPVLDQLHQSDKQELLVYGWCRSVKPTTGRTVGNMGLVVASAAVSGYETAVYGYPVTYSDPGAFALDNSTLFVAYIIDPGSGEVLEIRQLMVPYDITKKERLLELARSIMQFPLAEIPQSP